LSVIMNNKFSNNSSNTKKIALSAILTSLSVVFLTIGSFIEILDLTSATIAGFAIILAVIEIGGFYPYLIYLSTSTLALLLIPNKLPALIFLCFCGFYPIFKAYIERFHYIIAWSVKISMFNIFFAIAVLVIKNLFGIIDPIFSFEIFIFIVANFAFLLYDIAMTKIIIFYIIKIRKLLGFKNYFE